MKHLFRIICIIGIIGVVFTGLKPQVVWADDAIPSMVYLPAIVNGSSQTNQQQAELTLQSFIQTLDRRDPEMVEGVFTQGKLAQPVVQQPVGNYGYVSSGLQDVTQFSLAQAPVIGLLAHNSQAGSKFFSLTDNQDLYLVMGDGSTRHFRISQIERYRALEPDSPVSDFINIENGELLTAAQLFAAYYIGMEHVILQTCISKDGNPSWGRLFVVALPVE